MTKKQKNFFRKFAKIVRHHTGQNQILR